jgi:hypothetical protein
MNDVEVGIGAHLDPSFRSSFSQGQEEARRFVETVGGGAGQIASQFGGAAGALKGFIGGFLAIEAVQKGTEIIKGFVEAGIEAQKVQADLRASVEVSGSAWSKYAEKIEQTVKSVTAMSRYDNTEVAAALERLVTTTGNAEVATSLLGNAADLAAAKHLDLGHAAEMLGRAVEGNVGVLRRMGVILDDNTKKMLAASDETTRAILLQGILNDKFGGRSAADLNTYAGQIAKLKAEWHDFAEDVGKELLEVFTPAIEAVIRTAKKGIDTLRDLGHTIRDVTVDNNATRETNNIAERFQKPGLLTPDEWAKQQFAKVDREARELAYAPKLTDDWKSDVDKLNESLGNLQRNLGVSAVLLHSQGAAVDAYKDSIVKLGDDAVRLGVVLPEAFRKAYDQAKLLVLPKLPIGQGTDNLANIMSQGGTDNDPFSKWFFNAATQEKITAFFGDLDDQDRITEAAWRKKLDDEENRKAMAVWAQIGQDFERRVVDPLADAFGDLATTGGKNFGQIMAQSFAETIRSGSKSLAGLLTDTMFGVKPDDRGVYHDAQGNPISHDQAIGIAYKNNPALAAGLGAATGFAGAYNTRGQSDLSAGLGAAAAGYSVATALASTGYGVIAGIVVAVGTYLGHLLQPSPSQDYKYGRPSIDRFGNATFGARQNYDANASEQVVAKVQQTYNEAFSGYNEILRTLHVATLKTFAVDPRIGRFEQGADLGNSPSQRFEQELQRWIDNGLPREIASHFYDALASGFVSHGMTDERFHQIFDQLDKLDPKKKLELLTTLATAITETFDAMKFFGTQANPNIGPVDASNSLFAQTRAGMNLSFADQLAKSDEDIFRLGDALQTAIGEDAIQKAKELGDLEKARQEAETAFLKNIINLQTAADRQLSGDIRDITLGGISDPQGKIDFLRRQYNEQQAILAGAKTPEEAEAARQELRSTILQILNIGQSLGPEAAAAYRQFAIEALTATNTEFKQVTDALGSTLDDVNKSFTERINPALDAFYRTLAQAPEQISGRPRRVQRRDGRRDAPDPAI